MRKEESPRGDENEVKEERGSNHDRKKKCGYGSHVLNLSAHGDEQ